MGSFLKKVNKKETIRYELADDPNEYLELRAALTKGEANQIMLAAPQAAVKPILDENGLPKLDAEGKPMTESVDPKADMEGGLKFFERFLELCLVNWTVTDENGNPVPPSVAAYRELSPEAGAWVDGELNKHIQLTLGRKDIEGKPSKSETTSVSETETPENNTSESIPS